MQLTIELRFLLKTHDGEEDRAIKKETDAVAQLEHLIKLRRRPGESLFHDKKPQNALAQCQSFNHFAQAKSFLKSLCAEFCVDLLHLLPVGFIFDPPAQ